MSENLISLARPSEGSSCAITPPRDASACARGGLGYCPCFTPGTKIKTDQGEVGVEDITVGTRVLTRDNGFQSVMWVGQRTLTPAQLIDFPGLMPVRIAANALGNGIPERTTRVSPQHRMLLSNAQIRQWYEADEVLIAAHLLTCFEGVTREEVATVTYIHFMFAQHEIVLADGAWSESYQPQDMSSGAIDDAHRNELLAIFPELSGDCEKVYPAARAGCTPSEMVLLQSRIK